MQLKPKSISNNHSYLIPNKTQFLFITNKYFLCFLMVTAADYQNPITKDMVEGQIPFNQVRGVVYFVDYQKFLGNKDWIDNLHEHLQLPKHQFCDIGEMDQFYF